MCKSSGDQIPKCIQSSVGPSPAASDLPSGPIPKWIWSPSGLNPIWSEPQTHLIPKWSNPQSVSRRRYASTIIKKIAPQAAHVSGLYGWFTGMANLWSFSWTIQEPRTFLEDQEPSIKKHFLDFLNQEHFLIPPSSFLNLLDTILLNTKKTKN